MPHSSQAQAPAQESTSGYRSINAKPIAGREKLRLPPFSPGPAPMLTWLPIEKLVVDDSYQRPMGSLAWRHIIKIAGEFDWSKFAPVIVAPVEGGFYAIIDGQHRTTAAFLREIKEVPCHIVQADRAKQAAAFAAVNSKVTRLSSNHVFHAELEAADPLAIRVAEVCKRAGVKIPRSRLSWRDRPANALFAIAAVKSVVQTYGDAVAITALQCITETGNGNAGMLRAVLIRALGEVLSQKPLWRDAGERLFRALDDIEFEEMILQAEADARVGVDSALSALVRRLGAWLDDRNLAQMAA
jgi:hypothetical protein